MIEKSKKYRLTKAVWVLNYGLCTALLVMKPADWSKWILLMAILPLLYLICRYPYYSALKKLSKRLYDKKGPKASDESIKASIEHGRYLLVASLLTLTGIVILPSLLGHVGEAAGFLDEVSRKDFSKRAIGVAYGLVIMAFGNMAPKLVDPADVAVNAPAWTREFAQFGAYVGIITGLLVIISFLTLPLDQTILSLVIIITVAAAIFGGKFALLYRSRRRELADREKRATG